VLRALDAVPREQFVLPEFASTAYADQAMPIACGQTISQPYVVAYMSEQLEVRPEHRVLEIGTGSGYQAAVLSRLAGQVFSVERYRTLADRARDMLARLGYDNVTVLAGDGLEACRRTRRTTASWSRRRPRPCRKPSSASSRSWYPAVAARPARWAAAHRAHPDGRGRSTPGRADRRAFRAAAAGRAREL